MVEKVFYMSITFVKTLGGGDGKGQEDKRGEVEIMFNFDDVDQYIAHWLRDNNAASLCIYYMICKMSPFWQEVSVEFLILGWPLRPGPWASLKSNIRKHI